MTGLPPLPEPELHWLDRHTGDDEHGFTAAQLCDYAHAAVLAERAACIQLVNGTEDQMHDERDFTLREAIVDAIRARGE